MTIPPIRGGGLGVPPLRIPVLTAPVSTGVPPLIGDDDVALPPGTGSPHATGTAPRRDDPPIALAGRLDAGHVLPETTRLALALESATRAMQHGRADQVLSELDAVWSNQLTSDSPWYLRTAALQLLGRTEDAEQVLRAAIDRLPRSAAMLYLLGVHTAHRGQLDAARLANEHALALHPTESLLWLQKAALAQRTTSSEQIAAMVQRATALSPTIPAMQWLATMMRLGDTATREPTPVMQRAIERLTPSSLPAISDEPAASPGPSSIPAGVLETALRYGLTLLDSPTQSARTATQAAAVDEPLTALGAILSGASSVPPERGELPVWEALVLVAAILVIAFVPSMRIPALMLSGAVTMLLVSRARR